MDCLTGKIYEEISNVILFLSIIKGIFVIVNYIKTIWKLNDEVMKVLLNPLKQFLNNLENNYPSS